MTRRDSVTLHHTKTIKYIDIPDYKGFHSICDTQGMVHLMLKCYSGFKS